ncbi:hypothetical protein BDW_10200 [Bdellovibrio bacteriovorus W]|nr:hypothetical protein BDW_10200 [Bdellovibrio bacteriovorus W]
MFSDRARLHAARHYTREFFEKLVSDLESSGFSDQSILLSHAVVGLENAKLSVEKFLKLERNYSAIIFVAHSPDRNETIKFLFINKNSRAVFADNTFPNAESEPPQIYVQSPDPARVYALMGFFKKYMETPSMTTDIVQFLLAIVCIFFISYHSYYFINKGFSFSQDGSIFRILGILIAVVFMFRFAAKPTGLWIKPKRELRLFYLANMALKGEYKDNPLVTVVLAVIATITAQVLMKFFGILT